MHCDAGIYCRPGAPNGVSIERPGTNFRRIAAQTTFDPGLHRGDNLEIGARNQFAVKYGDQSSKVWAIGRNR